MADTNRYFVNELPEYDGETLINSNGKMIDEISSKFLQFINCRMHIISDALHNGRCDMKDSSVYTGLTGILMLYQKLLTEHQQYERDISKLLAIIRRRSLKSHKIAFLCGVTGPLTICAEIIGQPEKTDYIKDILHIEKCLEEDYHTDELLNGKAGYLYSLLYLHQFSKMTIDSSTVKKTVKSIIDDGLSTKSSSNSMKLNFTWHEKQYIGAAHGYIGILYMLLQAKDQFPDCVENEHLRLIENCLNKLIDMRFPSNNILSSIGSHKDRLVHWCHGAPGAIHLYLIAYKIFRNPRYLTVAEEFADVIWRRGLLQRGYGLCHGVAGNGYGFIAMYQSTNDMKYLWKAVKFAEWCLDYDLRICRTPDRPFSLYEGLAGTLYFLWDLMKPLQARFPGYQLVAYS